MKFEADLPHCLKNMTSKHVLEVATICVQTGLNPARYISENPGQYVRCHCLNFFGDVCFQGVNSQNSCIWASENPNAINEEPLHSEKIGVWCGMSRRHIIGPIFFEGTIKTATYMEIFNTFVNQLDDKELSIGYFQQDGATSHTSHASMAEIPSFFCDRVISKGLWPQHSPDLRPPHYFLWGYLKGRVYQTNHEP